MTLLVLPLGSAFILASIALVALWRGRSRLAGGFLTAALFWAWLWATPIPNAFLAHWFPNPTIAERVEALPNADAIVVLAGHVVPAIENKRYDQISRTADRVWHAARLYRAAKAPLVIASGGAGWDVPGDRPAAVVMRDFLVELGVPSAAVMLEPESRDTRENAVNTVAIAKRHGIAEVLLVTSPRHMPRAAAAFAKAGMTVTPASHANAPPGWRIRLISLLPSVGALVANTYAVREVLAIWAYRLRGWA